MSKSKKDFEEFMESERKYYEFRTPKRHLLLRKEDGSSTYVVVYTADITGWLEDIDRINVEVYDVTDDYQHEINATGAPF